MEEKRRNKRLDINVDVKLEQLGVDTKEAFVPVRVLDVSKSGMGFISEKELAINSTYETRIEIWTKEVLNVFIKIVRESINDDGDRVYGAIFIGMTDADALKIDIYRIFNEM